MAKNSSALDMTEALSPLEQLRESAGSKVDFYEPSVNEAPSPGIYRVERDEEGYSILFSPCAGD